MHMGQQHHSSCLEITALAPAVNAGKECVHGVVVGYIVVYKPKRSHLTLFSPFKTNNKQSWNFTVATLESLFLPQLPHLSGINPWKTSSPHRCQFIAEICTQFLKPMNGRKWTLKQYFCRVVKYKYLGGKKKEGLSHCNNNLKMQPSTKSLYCLRISKVLWNTIEVQALKQILHSQNNFTVYY